MPDVCANYLFDVGRRFLHEAVEAKQSRDALQAQGANKMAYEFQAGRALAYYEVLSVLIGQAQAFGLDLEILGLAGVDPDELLLS